MVKRSGVESRREKAPERNVRSPNSGGKFPKARMRLGIETNGKGRPCRTATDTERKWKIVGIKEFRSSGNAFVRRRAHEKGGKKQ